ncbi:MAG: hypothetical protein IKO93_09630 [Lentisphaeria bacterium]|nr:hypothetical protein [Lentisphaeria bacterium]
MTCITDLLNGDNASASLQAAFRTAAEKDRELFFPAGEYHFYPEGCSSRYCFFSNNDEGVKTIALLLENLDGFTVRGENARLIFHGRISPLCAFSCRDLTVEGLTVDFEDSFVSDADLVKRENGLAWFRFFGKHHVADGRIVFCDDAYDNMNGKLLFYCYDRMKKEIIYNSHPIPVRNEKILYCDGLIGMEDRFASAGTDAFIVKHELRLCPGMVFDDCDDLKIRNVTLHHAAGMGFLIQNSENCEVDGAVVEPHGRRVSVSDDALHITDCRGKLRITNCRLSGTLDDSINVHGVFRKLKSRTPGGKMYYLEAGYYQQQGVFHARAGDTIQLFNRAGGKPYGNLKIKKVTPCNKAFVIVDIDERELPAAFVQGDPALILETLADLEVIDTECRPLNGRGVLASGMDRVHISGCRFHSSGAGVFISGDFSFWYESGPVKEALIENNFFDNCNYYAFGATQEPLAVFPELASLAENYYYHGRIEVKNNRFRAAERPLVSIMSAAEAEVTGNVFEADGTYPFVPHSKTGYFFTDGDSPAAAFRHCGTVRETDNSGFRKGSEK